MNRFQPKGRSRVYALTGLTLIMIYIFIFITALIGWVMNIVKLVDLLADPLTVEAIVRIIGIPIGFIGAIFGWF